MFRVYDKKKKKFLYDDVFLGSDDVIFKYNCGFLKSYLRVLSANRYVFQNCIEIPDVNNRLIFEGDKVKYKLDSKTVQDIVSYVSQIASYMVIDHKDQICYPIRANGDEINVEIEVIGNVFEDKNTNERNQE